MNLEFLTSEVCKIAKEGGHFLAQERKTFRKDRVEEKNAHDYVSYVDKETERLLVARLSQLLPSGVYYGRRYCCFRKERLLLGYRSFGRYYQLYTRQCSLLREHSSDY